MRSKQIEEAEYIREEMVSFLRDLVEIPSPSCEEKEVVERMKGSSAEFRADATSLPRLNSQGNFPKQNG